MYVWICMLQVPCNGADGCQPVPGNTDGSGSRADVVPALPDALWHQASPLGWNHPQSTFPMFSMCMLTVWNGGVMDGQGIGLVIKRSRVQLNFHVTTLGNSVTKWSNLVLVKRQWWSAGGKVTVGLAESYCKLFDLWLCRPLLLNMLVFDLPPLLGSTHCSCCCTGLWYAVASDMISHICFDWLIDLLIDWLTDWLVDWLIYLFIDWFIYLFSCCDKLFRQCLYSIML